MIAHIRHSLIVATGSQARTGPETPLTRLGRMYWYRENREEDDDDVADRPLEATQSAVRRGWGSWWVLPWQLSQPCRHTFSVVGRPKMPSGLNTIKTIRIRKTTVCDQVEPSP